MIQSGGLFHALNDALGNLFFPWGYKGTQTNSLHQIGSELDGYGQTVNSGPPLIWKSDFLND